MLEGRYYREAPKGSPKGKDERYVKGLTLVEERLVLIRARTGAEAIRKGEQSKRAVDESCAMLISLYMTTSASTASWICARETPSSWTMSSASRRSV